LWVLAFTPLLLMGAIEDGERHFSFTAEEFGIEAVIDTVPADIIVADSCSVPPADTIRFINTMTTDTLLTVPFDSTSSTGLMADVDYCAGDTIWRIWRDTFPGDMSIVEEVQRIVVEADMEAPISSFTADLDTIIACELANDALGPWYTNVSLTIGLNLPDGCNDVEDVSFSFTPSNVTIHPCDTLELITTVTDLCGNARDYTARFITLDTVAPLLQNLPEDTLSLSCDTIDQYLMNNPSTMVTVQDCDPNLVPTYTLDSLPVPSQCSDGREYNLRRTWTVMDSCGNSSEAVQFIRVRDQQAPTFTQPGPVTISCEIDVNDLSITGDVIDTLDNCGGPISLTYNDAIIDQPGSCDNFYFIQRLWTATDVCGNSRNVNQTITVQDTVPPAFIVPADTTVNCGLENDLDVVGRPSMLSDNCSTLDSISFEIVSEDLIAGSCDNDYIVERTWRVVDECGNDSLQIQRITVIDTIAPTFSTPSADLVITCMEGISLEEAYSDWIDDHAGAVAEDLCTMQSDLSWQALDAMTMQPVGSMPLINCPTGNDTLFQQTVIFVVDDGCGNSRTTQAQFIIIDDTPPVFESCPADQVVGTDMGQCSANFTLEVPEIKEECAASLLMENISASATISSDAPPGQESIVPVNPINLSFPVSQPLPVNAVGSATLDLGLINVDAEGSTEFFFVYGEDGTLIGRTGRASVQCSNADTSLFIAPSLIDAWAVDGIVEIRLEPNEPVTQQGSFAINAVCSPAGQVSANLSFGVAELVNVDYAYRVNGGNLIGVDPIAPTTVTLPIGTNRVTYFAADCAGNIDSCSYEVLVEDQEPPILSCPSDIDVTLDPGNCSAFVTLPLPNGLIDNCAIGTPAYDTTLPADTASAWLTFVNDPNLNDYIATPKSYTFTGLAANALGTVNLTLSLRGDFNSTGATANIVVDNTDTLTTTPLGLATCTNPGQLSISIPADDFNNWASDGEITFTLEPQFIAVPPGGPGDGINPCDPAVVDTDGEVDSVSYAFMRLRYQRVTPLYFAEGATSIPLTQMVEPELSPEHEFDLGTTMVSYIAEDAVGNQDTCTYNVNIIDNEPPVARCRATIVPINPSGLDVDTVQVADFDDGSFDNCTIDTMFLTPNTFGCDQAGSTINATLTVIDLAGNQSTCTNLIRIEAEAPEPTFSPGICGGDTLYLFANPPPAEGGIVYSYEWRGPNGQLVSIDENPILPNVDQDDAGAYVVTIEGITGCVAEGVVNVTIINQPLTAQVQANDQQCADEDIVLTSSITLGNATYHWYQGQAPNGTLLQSTTSPSLTISALNVGSPTTLSYYLIIESNGCLSDPSPAKTVQITPRPQAVVNTPVITVCEGSPFSLGTNFSGAGITYQWTGPDGFESNLQFPPTIQEAELVDEGAYQLIVTRNGCSSNPAFTFVNVNPRPAKPILPNERNLCDGDTLTLLTLPAGATSYTWTAPDLSTITTATNTLVLPDADMEYNGTWTVTSTQFGCESEVSNPLQVNVNIRPEAQVMADETQVCERGSFQLTGSPTLQDATYRWTGPNGFTSFLQSPSVSNMSAAKAGTYTFRVRTPAGCTDTASVNISMIESVDILAVSNSAPNCLYGPTNINLQATVFPANDGSYTFEWSGPGFMSSDSVAVIESATGTVNGNEYTLVVFTEEGCPSLPQTTEIMTQNAPARPTTPVAEGSPMAAFCEGDEITISTTPNANPSAVYIWSTPSGQLSTGINSELNILQATTDDQGIYRVFAIVNGCPSFLSEPLTVTVNPIPAINAFSNSPVCEGEALELFAESATGASYEWSGPITSALQNPTINAADSMLHTGDYQVVATLNGCPSAPATVSVEINETPSPVMNIINNGPICIDEAGATLALTASGMPVDNYYWYLNGEAFDTTISPNLLVEELATLGAGPLFIEAEAVLGDCVSDPSPGITVQLDSIPDEVAVAGQDTSVCAGEALTLGASPGGVSTGQWFALGGSGIDFSDPAAANAIATGFTAQGDVELAWSLSNGACRNFSLDTVAITVNTIIPALAGNDTLLCAGDPIVLDANLPLEAMGAWSQSIVQEDFNIFIDEPDNPATTISGPGVLPGNTYVFTWTVTSECGSDSAEVFIRIADNNPIAGADQIACNEQGEVMLMATEPADGSLGRWSSPDDMLVFSNRNNISTTVNNLAEGENIMVWTLDEGLCGEDSRDTVIVDYQLPPRAFDDQASVSFAIESQIAVLANDDVPEGSNIFIVSDPSRGQARVIDGTIIAYTPDPNFVGADQLVYEVCREGCACDEAVLRLEVGEGVLCEAPNIITPNGDGVNDAFIIPCLLDGQEYMNSQLLVFNRWGDEVYRSPVPYPNDWGGTFNGAELPVDTYFYILDLGDGSDPQSGFLLIQR
jgi:gliding motility-associated-like protein